MINPSGDFGAPHSVKCKMIKRITMTGQTAGSNVYLVFAFLHDTIKMELFCLPPPLIVTFFFSGI